MARMYRNTKTIFASICTILFGSAIAQISSGSLYQQYQREGETTILPDVSPKQAEKPQENLKPRPGETAFFLKKINFEGNTLISNDDLEKITTPFLNQSTSFTQLQKLVSEITNYYLSQGWLVKVVIPKQEVLDGVVTFRIIESTLGSIVLNNQSQRITNSRIEAWVYSQNPQGTPLSLTRLDKTVLILNDRPDLDVVDTLKIGEEVGSTDLVLTIKDKPLIVGNAAVDNYGDSSIGVGRASTSLAVNGLLGAGDQINIYGLATEGSAFGRLGGSIPIGSNGLRVGVNGSYMGYKILNSSFNQLGVNGTASNLGVDASYPIIRSKPKNLIAIASLGYGEFANWNAFGKVPNQNYTSTIASVGLSGNLLENYFGDAINTGSVSIGFGGTNNGNQLVSGLDNGSFKKINYSLSRLQSIMPDTSIYASLDGQLTNSALNSSQQMYLGGPFGVRAYSSGQGPAMQANILTVEARQNLILGTRIVAFYDYGSAQPYKGVSSASSSPWLNSSYALQGAGLMLAWRSEGGSQVSATWAHATGAIPTQLISLSGGSISANRFWFAGTFLF